jgi:phenylacetate-coenzyme A ligase PaaK-like adenylate-forming protein
MCAPGDHMLVMMSGETTGSIGDTVRKALAPFPIRTTVCGGVAEIAEAYACIRETAPNVIVGMPNQTAALARYGARFGNPEAAHIKSVLLSADDIPDAVRNTVAWHWNCRVFNHYGMTEMCIAGGVECEGFSGYHTRDCDLLFEIVDPDENGVGEVVFTTLDREAMPLIRYRTGDLGRFSAGPCPCGSPLRRIERVFGRKRNRIPLGGGAWIHLREIAEAVFSEPWTADYECALRDAGVVEIFVKVLSGRPVDDARLRAALMKHGSLSNAIKNRKNQIVLHFAETDRFANGAAKKFIQDRRRTGSHGRYQER